MKVTQPREKIGKEVEARLQRLAKILFQYRSVPEDEWSETTKQEYRSLCARHSELEALYVWMTRKW